MTALPDKTRGFSFASGPELNIKHLLDLRHPAKHLPLFRNKKSGSQLSGGHRSSFRGRGMDFDEVRIYQAGDDVRSIDWRVTARTAQTHTKIFREEKERPLLLVIDQRSPMVFGTRITYKSVMAAQLAGLLGWAGLNDNDKVGGIVFNDFHHKEIKPKRHHNALLSLLHQTVEQNQQALASAQHRMERNASTDTTSAGLALENILERVWRMALPGTAVFIISDFHDYDEACEKLLSQIKRHTDLNVLIVADAMEEQLPSHQQLCISNGMQKRHINALNKRTRQDYQQAFAARQNALQKSFRKIGARHMLLWTHSDPFRTLKQFLQGGGAG